MATQEQERDVRIDLHELILQGRVYRDQEGRCYPPGDPNFKDLDHSITSTAALICTTAEKTGVDSIVHALQAVSGTTSRTMTSVRAP